MVVIFRTLYHTAGQWFNSAMKKIFSLSMCTLHQYFKQILKVILSEITALFVTVNLIFYRIIPPKLANNPLLKNKTFRFLKVPFSRAHSHDEKSGTVR